VDSAREKKLSSNSPRDFVWEKFTCEIRFETGVREDNIHRRTSEYLVQLRNVDKVYETEAGEFLA